MIRATVGIRVISALLVYGLFGVVSDAVAIGETSEGTIKLRITDAETGKTIPARVEVTGADGANYIANDALPVGGDCDTSAEFGDEEATHDLEKSLTALRQEVIAPFTHTRQFYSTGESEVTLPAGPATILIMKGPEYRVYRTEIEVSSGESVAAFAELSRWANMPQQGWYSADDHLHIARPVKELNPYVHKMMQAEDIHVANLVQMGKEKNFSIAAQYAHGRDGRYHQGNHIIASGQENPRTHLLGHSLTLGADKALHDSERYLVYRLLWERAKSHGGVNGMAHFGWSGGGLAILLPHDLMSFMEVLQFNIGEYDAWYEALNLGFRVAPTAGSDFPCGGPDHLPGNERFYTKVVGEFTFENWIEGVERGRTFVTTGPLLEFTIDGADIGEELSLNKPGLVRLKGRVRFDAEKDNLSGLEIVENGEIIYSIPHVGDGEEISFEIDHHVSDNAWIAVRAFNNEEFHKYWLNRAMHGSIVHSAPIYVSVKGAPPLQRHPRAKALARKYHAQLEALELRLQDENLEKLALELAQFPSDAVSKDGLIHARDDLVKDIQFAKKFFLELSE